MAGWEFTQPKAYDNRDDERIRPLRCLRHPGQPYSAGGGAEARLGARPGALRGRAALPSSLPWLEEVVRASSGRLFAILDFEVEMERGSP